jgi:hypothetical protein
VSIASTFGATREVFVHAAAGITSARNVSSRCPLIVLVGHTIYANSNICFACLELNRTRIDQRTESFALAAVKMTFAHSATAKKKGFDVYMLRGKKYLNLLIKIPVKTKQKVFLPM